MTLRIEAAFEPLEGEWDDLARRARAGPFLSSWWFRSWWRAFGQSDPRLVTLRRSGRLAALLPLYGNGHRLHSMTNLHSCHFGTLAEDVAAADELAAALFELPAHVELDYLGGPEARAFARLASDRRVLLTPGQRSPFVDTRDDWNEYEKSLPSKLLANLRRRRRQLEEHGEVTIEIADGSARFYELLAEGFAVEPSGWKEARGTAIVSDASTERFYTAVAESAAAAGVLRLSFLRLDGQPIAFQYGFEDGRSYYFLKGGFDPAQARYAPGKLLVHALLERAFGLGLATFEFLGADEPWKLDWTTKRRERMRLQAFLRSPGGLFRHAASSAYLGFARPLAKRALHWAR
jgi:CelD/BcsL family acetyltransferase involved in cellulose biosynthesis